MRIVIVIYMIVVLSLLVALFDFLHTNNSSWAFASGVALATVALGGLYIYWLDKADILCFGDTVMRRGEYRENMPATLAHTIFELAKKEIRAFHGDLAPVFFNNNKIIDALKGQKGSLLHTHIIFGPKVSVKIIPFFRLVRQGRVTLYQLQEEIPCEEGKFHHFTCVDGIHVWLEYCHDPDQCAAGYEWTHEPHLCQVCGSYFKQLLKKSKKVDPTNIIDSIGEENFVGGYKNGKWIPATKNELKELKDSLVIEFD